jgi:hypothetical protein
MLNQPLADRRMGRFRCPSAHNQLSGKDKGDPGNEVWPSIKGLNSTVTPFQLDLKYFKRRQHFFDPGECDNAHSQMGTKKWWTMVHQNSCSRDTTMYDVYDPRMIYASKRANSQAEKKECWLLNEEFLYGLINLARVNGTENFCWIITCLELSYQRSHCV